jgi:polyisoprenoid-binding protein YceI
MKTIILATVFSLVASTGFTQKVFTKNGTISFFSKTDMEDIYAKNSQVMSVLNTATGEIQFSVLIKSFNFEKALMQEHFNENYMESDKFPKSSFKGSVDDKSKVDFSKDGTYSVTVSGELEMHGVKNKVSAVPSSIIIKDGKISGNSKFKVKLADYGIKVPNLVKDNISEIIEVTVACNYDQKM